MNILNKYDDDDDDIQLIFIWELFSSRLLMIILLPTLLINSG